MAHSLEEMDILPSQEHQEKKEGVWVTNEKGTEEGAIGGKGEGMPGSKKKEKEDLDVTLSSEEEEEEEVENVPIQEDREEFRPVTMFPSTIEGFGYRFNEGQ